MVKKESIVWSMTKTFSNSVPRRAATVDEHQRTVTGRSWRSSIHGHASATTGPHLSNTFLDDDSELDTINDDSTFKSVEGRQYECMGIAQLVASFA